MAIIKTTVLDDEVGKRCRQHRETPRVIETSGMIVNLNAMQAYIRRGTTAKNEPFDLTQTELNLLSALITSPVSAFARLTLLKACLPESGALEHVIETHILNLRKKLDGCGITYVLRAFLDVGYRFALA